MELSVLCNLFGKSMELNELLSYLHSLGVESVEVGAGGYPGKNQCDPALLLRDSEKLAEFKETFEKNKMSICALACHGNPVHPNKAEAERYHADFVNAVLLAEKLGVKTVVGFSGCPGDSESSRLPNWVTCSWPPEYGEILKYQWSVLVPYWKKTAAFARDHGVERIAFEMHPGFCVYNPETLIRLREETGMDNIGANFDPSHLIWQGIDPALAIRNLGKLIYHFHAKDTAVDPYNRAANGVLSTAHYGNEASRPWVFRTVGYGSDAKVWKDMMSALQLAGYGGAISIEHEDSLMTVKEGLEKAVTFMKDVMIHEKKPGSISWA